MIIKRHVANNMDSNDIRNMVVNVLGGCFFKGKWLLFNATCSSILLSGYCYHASCNKCNMVNVFIICVSLLLIA